ncbi:812a99c9-917f-4626-a02b-1eac00f1c0b2 [Sclerotinia trifoliorum]|uniref:812a99c9-917f-4626-a02b-1eac00f1c0b2 n=1 Tax=Sclerotinia trifoliorum TaxID=28548 RepID=A0A8H2ZRL2_9HELO|nr:812a99c9-917f-4626-a02b-1eac00f1c0b2 [Sclerotinia trifoliorum]
MSGYSRHNHGHDPYIDYAAQSEEHPERVYGSHHPELQQVGTPGLESLHLGAHHHQQQQQQQQQQQHHHQVLLDPHSMAHHQSPQYGGGQQMRGYIGAPMQQASSVGKRPRAHDELGMGMGGVPAGHMHGQMQGISSQMSQQTMGGYGGGPQAFHSHALPNQGPRGAKFPRLGEAPESSMMSQGAPSVVGTAGMPLPAARPRGPKLKFTPEDDQLLVDLKENKALTWKQIAEFFPGRSSGTLQVRYCTKLKAKTTQWTDETVQKLRTAVHDYEQEKWRIVAQKVGTGFTSTACKDKWTELMHPDDSELQSPEPEDLPEDAEY